MVNVVAPQPLLRHPELTGPHCHPHTDAETAETWELKVYTTFLGAMSFETSKAEADQAGSLGSMEATGASSCRNSRWGF